LSLKLRRRRMDAAVLCGGRKDRRVQIFSFSWCGVSGHIIVS